MSIMTYDGNVKYVNYATVQPSSGNIAGGNITTTGLVSALGNITAGNLNSPTLNNSGNINVVAGSNTWTFGTTGRLINLEGLTLTAGGQFNICNILTGGSGYDTGSALKATTGGSGTGMTVGIGYGLSNQLTNADVVDPGTGYVDGDVITVSGGTGGTFVITRYNEQANQSNNNFIQSDWTFGTDGSLTLPIGVSIDYNGNIQYPKIIADSGKLFSIQGQGNTGSAALAWTVNPNAASQYAAVAVNRAGDNLAKVILQAQSDSGNVGTVKLWKFDETGNLTLPANTFSVNYANGSPVTFSGGSSNTGNVTFDNQAVVGTGDQVGSSGLYLAPGTESVGNLQYIRVRGGDVATHIHLDTGNNAYFDQYFGSDIKYVKLEAAGNVVIGSDDDTGNSAQWTFETGGNLTFPTGNLVIIPDHADLGNSAVIGSSDHNLITLSTGANGGLSSLWVEDLANATSNIAAVYANPVPGSGNVRIAVGPNSSPGPNLWDFDASGNLSIPGNINFSGDSSAAPSLNDFFSVTSAANFSIITDSANTDQTWTFSTSGNLTAPGNISATGNVTANSFVGNGATLSNVATTFESAWTVPVGTSTQSFTVNSGTYSMWVDCNIPNGILTWNATATVTNTNVPVLGVQYAWVYNGGGTPIDFTSIPNQFVGTANAILRSNVSPSATTNRFDFGINNTSGGNVTVRYGWAQIS